MQIRRSLACKHDSRSSKDLRSQGSRTFTELGAEIIDVFRYIGIAVVLEIDVRGGTLHIADFPQ